MRRFLVSAMVLILSISTQALASRVVSTQPSNLSVRIEKKNDRIVFSRCIRGDNGFEACYAMGRTQGFTLEELNGRMESLNAESDKRFWYSTGAIVLATVAGGVYGMAKYPGSAGNFDFTPLVRIFNGGKNATIGLIGSTIAVYLVTRGMQDLDAASVDLAKSTNSIVDPSTTIKIDGPIATFIQSLNYALAGIE